MAVIGLILTTLKASTVFLRLNLTSKGSDLRFKSELLRQQGQKKKQIHQTNEPITKRSLNGRRRGGRTKIDKYTFKKRNPPTHIPSSVHFPMLFFDIYRLV